MNNLSQEEKTLIISYLTLRKIIGLLAVSLPLILSLGALIIEKKGIQSSISAYYFTSMGDIFIGILFAIGFFLFSYKGYKKGKELISDDMAGNIAGFLVIGVAVFPTRQLNTNVIHGICAVSFFLILSYFCIVLFTKTKDGKSPHGKKKKRNSIYRACGTVMLLCIGLLVVYIFFLPQKTREFVGEYNLIYWLEAIAILAFGISWLTKGEAILKDN
ncbi:MAG: DUF998 domain-containing protein [Spirochaetia bacterium]|nr:DUF998 domain-containing protein [Spirochaetia bacterium]